MVWHAAFWSAKAPLTSRSHRATLRTMRSPVIQMPPGSSSVLGALRRFFSAMTGWVLVPLVATFVTVAACATPALAPVSPVATAPSIPPAATTSVPAAQPSSLVFRLTTADELEQLLGRGQPVLLAVLDTRNDDILSETSG